MAHKVSVGGSYRIDKVFPPPVGRIAQASGTTTKAAFRNVVACLDRLAERGRLDVLLALRVKRVSMAQVLDADRADTLDDLLASLTATPASAPFWPAVQAWLGPAWTLPSTESNLTMRRYATSLRKLERFSAVETTASVSALREVDWQALSHRWSGSGSDWNQMRRAISRFLTLHLGDVYDPLRRAVVKAIPVRKERERVPDLDAPTFWRVVEAAPAHVRASFVAIVVLGLRTGEYLRLKDTDLHPLTKSVSIPGTKTAGSATVLRVDPGLWPWIVSAVPAPVGYNWLRRYWKRALAAVGADTTLRLHDLRHLMAQLLVNAGQSEASVQTTMRHATADMTRRYARQRDHGENAAALARVLLEAKSA